MPYLPPPATSTAPLVRHVLRAGTTLWRTHRGDPDSFDPPPASPFAGRRFDGTPADSVGSLYASIEQATALAEELLPNFDASPVAPRILNRSWLRGLRLSGLRTITDLNLIQLTSATELASIGQDEWLLQARDGHYATTRAWSSWLRRCAPWADGIVWMSMVDLPNATVVLFEDRCKGMIEAVSESKRLDEPGNGPWLAGVMARWGVETRDVQSDPPVVFLNYRTGDGDAAAVQLHRELATRFGERRVFRDVLSIRPGDDFERTLLANARSAKIMLSVVGPNWETFRGHDGTVLLSNSDDWVRTEIREALGCAVPVIPVLVGQRLRLSADHLPDDIKDIHKGQYLTISAELTDADVRNTVDKLLRRRPELNEFVTQ